MIRLLSATSLVLVWLAAPAAGAVSQQTINLAIERGIVGLRSLQTPDGAWVHHANSTGSTALVGLTLLECGVKPDDAAIVKAARNIRQAAPTLTYTYAVALSILFLDRLGDPNDVPLIQVLGARLLGGQKATGGWGYECPAIGGAEMQRLLKATREKLGGKRDVPARNDEGDRPIPKLPEELQQLLPGGATTPPQGIDNVAEDNSNTQFATLGLWVARRHGLPIERAMRLIELRFRQSQNSDGGWSYTYGAGMSTPTMTAAGVLCLAVSDGAAADARARSGGEAKSPPLKDANLLIGLTALATTIGNPVGNVAGPLAGLIPRAGGRSFYYLWTLERVAMALGLDTIGKKNWYQWGAEILVVSQDPRTGLWQGDYAGGVDSCFALLFLARSNLAKDLTARLRGAFRDPGSVTLRSGGVGGEGLKGARPLKPAIEPPGTAKSTPEQTPNGTEEPRTSKPAPTGNPEATGLVDEIVRAPAGKLDGVLKRLRDAKGVANTEALAAAIPQLTGDSRHKARDTLAERLSRMRAASLVSYLRDEDAEIRRGAALALAMKESKVHIPQIIGLLNDPEEAVVRGAHAALKDLAGVDFGPVPRATAGEKERAVEAWRAWWQKNKRD